MLLLIGCGLLVVFLFAADLLLLRRRQVRTERARAEAMAYTRRLQESWNARRPG